MKTLTLFLIMQIAFWGYWFAVYFKFGIQPSISQSYYSWKKHSDQAWTPRLWFWFMILGISIPFIVIMETGWGFLGGSLVALIGAAADYRIKSVLKPHLLGSFVGIPMCLVAEGLKHGGWAWLGIGLLALVFGVFHLAKVKNKTWWIETAAFVIASINVSIYEF